MKQDIEIKLPLNGATASLNGRELSVKGSQGEVLKSFLHPKVSVSVQNDEVILNSIKATKREKTIINTYASQIKGMVKGSNEKFEYKLKICSGFFPMNVSVSGNELIIKNFLGENSPRKVTLDAGVNAKVNGDEVIVTSCDKELAGINAGRIELACRITNKDRRIFQAGIWITSKAGKEY